MRSAAPTIAVDGAGRYGTDVVRMATAKGWPVVAALIALLCLEWSFRKRKGLV